MSGFHGHDRDFSEYNHMSTDDLEAILRADFELPDDGESDMEKILYIMEVIAQRRAGQPTGRYANADEAWDSFVENYCPEPERGALRGSGAVRPGKPRRGKRFLTRVAAIAAVIVLVAAAGTATASAFGFNFWAWLTGWSREVFSVQDPEITYSNKRLEVPEQLAELQEAMEEYGFPDQLLPTKLPDGYEATELKCEATPFHIRLLGTLKNSKDNFILLDYCMHLDDETAVKVQKDDDEPEAYDYGDTTHYIMTNYETYYASWTVDHVVCVISGFASRDDLIQTINSIYGGQS